MRRSKLLLLVSVLSYGIVAGAEQVPFQRVIELAVAHSPAMGIAAAEQSKAQQAYQEAKNAYLPNLVLGSGLGYSYGYPLSLEGSAPSIFNVNYQSSLYNPAVREFIKSAKLEWNAAATSKEDQRKDVILDASATYIQLDRVLASLKSMREQEVEANRLADLVAQRVQQGLDSQVELTRSKLVAARTRMRIAEMEGNADLLRNRLSQLTGLTADSIDTITESIPALPEVDQQADLASRAVENSSAVKAAQQRAEAQQIRAKGEWKSLYPSFDLVGQYAMFAKFNNYEDYFKRFQTNNATVGIAIKLPLLNFAQRAHAAQADADALKAKKQADAVKGQVSAETLKLQRAVKQLGTAQQVAQLDYELAKAEAEAAQIRAESGAGAPTEPNQPSGVVTARDAATARIQASDKYSQYLDTSFEYDKARLQLLRATGELEAWAGAPK
ncbi:MAG TPA: TolC family protein [Terriglobales bacterium]|nr:TolC family protein [Terriglobales bacterium]